MRGVPMPEKLAFSLEIRTTNFRPGPLPHTRLEARTAKVRRRGGAAHPCVPLSARNEQVEQNRASALLPHHPEQNWRGKPLTSYETVVNLIGSTRTTKGLRVKARLDKRQYPTGGEITKAEMKSLALRADDFHGDWNYVLESRRTQ
ncbi:transposase [Stigmatella aurantiaca DW4/3-1]|uniref:Transposase n=1 Tax=Stigmatella aurantiaca (strain DW4/3-1) TaxID=378806 RepID=E3G0F8_STIAD|nr:transposase [Stigmatella aurantiaca DW4/3-1]